MPPQEELDANLCLYALTVSNGIKRASQTRPGYKLQPEMSEHPPAHTPRPLSSSPTEMGTAYCRGGKPTPFR